MRPTAAIERKSRQVGTVDADFPHIRYAVPTLASEPRVVLKSSRDGLGCRMVGTLIRTLIGGITQSHLIHGHIAVG